jgi:hypothetical protein
MATADRGEGGWNSLRVFATERRAEAEAALERIRKEGPCVALNFEERRSRQGWWKWTDTKRALEPLFRAGHITTATRLGSFERVYSLTERFIPAKILALRTPDEGQARCALVERAALAWRRHRSGVALELRDYFRLGPEEGKIVHRRQPRRSPDHNSEVCRLRLTTDHHSSGGVKGWDVSAA